MYDGGTNAVNNIKGIHSDGEKRRIGVWNSGKEEGKSGIESRNIVDTSSYAGRCTMVT